MSYFFGLGEGHLSRKAARIARRHGAMLINYADPGCKCGHGCHDDCPACKRHWFECPNLGEPFDSAIARAVMTEIQSIL